MTMPSDLLVLLAGYSLLIVAASLLGGWLPTLVRLTHVRTQLAMCFVAGFMLWVALNHLLPHALAQTQATVDLVMSWVMAGVIMMLLLQRMFHFHQHDYSDHEQELTQQQRSAHSLSWLGIAAGLSVHTLVAGIALGSSIQAESHGGASGWLGFGVFLAIALHKPLDAMSITVMMKASGWNATARNVVNMGFALLCPVGALLFLWGVGHSGSSDKVVIACALAFSAGVFLCISLSDLLPEVHFHSHDRGKLAMSFLLGIGVAFALGYLEPEVHQHGTSEPPPTPVTSQSSATPFLLPQTLEISPGITRFTMSNALCVYTANPHIAPDRLRLLKKFMFINELSYFLSFVTVTK
ncbi:MAG: ZIP family metal transporter [Halieaceae bacterium]|nr:ZIP family metal transporter [Halieaceae bacterium]